MTSVFKRNGKGSYIIQYYDHNGRRHEKSSRTTDKRTAERIAGKLESNAALRREGVIDARAESIGKRAQRPIAEHLHDWRESLQAKGCSPKRVKLAFGRASRIASECAFATLAQVDPAPVHRLVREMQGSEAAPRTINAHLQAFKQFIRWAVAERRLAANPLLSVGSVKVIGQTRERRPLSPDEFVQLIDASRGGPILKRMTGPDRAMLYLVAVGSGFRANELASLNPRSFDLTGDPPTITVQAAYSKRRRDDVQPIRQDLADALEPWLKGKSPEDPVFSMPSKLPPMLRADMRRAKASWIRGTNDRAERCDRHKSDFLAYIDGYGRVVDFHALRSTYITMLVKGGASVKEAQQLARHSDPKLTMNVYTKLSVHDLVSALDGLPAMGPTTAAPQSLRATGTYDSSPTKDPPQIPQQSARETVQSEATRRDAHHRSGHQGEKRKSFKIAEKRDATRHNAPPSVKATSGIRTLDLRFTKAPLYH